MKTILKAPAKINICLKINGKSHDNFHDITTIMQSISLYDILEINVIKAKKGEKFDRDEQINLACNFQYIPIDDKNLVVKITRSIFDKFSIRDKIDINLKKMIPTGAGLGGGSSDAASILLFLNRYYKLRYNLKTLSALAMEFGSDIPYFLYKKESLCKGRGEIVKPIASFKNYYVLIATPDVRVSTKDVYLKYDEIDIPPNLDQINKEKVTNLLFALERNDMDIFSRNIFNDLELATMKEICEIEELKSEMLKEGAKCSLMSGSGPTVFGIFDDIISAKRCKEYIKQRHERSFAFVAKPL